MTFFPHSSRSVCCFYMVKYGVNIWILVSAQPGHFLFHFHALWKCNNSAQTRQKTTVKKRRNESNFEFKRSLSPPSAITFQRVLRRVFFSNVIRNVGAWQRIKHVNQTLSVCALECCACTHRFHVMSRFALALSLSIGFAILFIYRHHDGPSC